MLKTDQMNWHQADIHSVISTLKTTAEGLTETDANKRLEEHGLNILQARQRKSAWWIFFSQFKDLMIIILTAAAIISGVAGDMADMVIILVIVLLNAIVGFIQEYRAEKAMDALKKMSAPHARVKRGKETKEIPASDLVPGDLVLLEAGDIVPADLRITESHALRMEEAALTGETVPVDKSAGTLDNKELSLGDRVNMAYKSTLVTNGRGAGLVTGTGMDTELGRIAGMLQNNEESKTPLQQRMADFGKKLSWIVMGICLVLFAAGLLRGEPVLKMLLVATSLAVAAIPEALPALITIALARGARRMVKKNALIRKLPAVETLGSVNYICTDKTGTLTQNKMQVEEVFPVEEKIDIATEDMPFLLFAMALNQDAAPDTEGKWKGDPTEIALIQYVIEKYPEDKVKAILEKFPREAELPFDSQRKCMSTVHRYGQQYLVITKGAAEAIVSRLKDQHNNEKILQQTDEQAAKGMRMLAYAWKVIPSLPEKPDEKQIEKDLSFAGLASMMDPPREEASAAIEECRKAGIRVVMITGDHLATATAIGRNIGLLQEGDESITGADLAKMDDARLQAGVEKIRIYARVSPEQKLNIIQALQRNGNYVAMTGDGVNDAPSLKAANIGVAMGITGTDVSKEAAHMILLDDNFATIVKAVREGRRIYDNIRKFVKYIMTCNGAEIWTFFLAPLLGLPIPLLPVHILWINLVTDGLPGLALAAERAEKKIMERPPARADESLFTKPTVVHIIWVGLLMTALTLGTQAWAINTGDTHWQTMVFTVLSLSQLGHVMAIRSNELIYRNGVFSNMSMSGALILTFALQMAVIYIPAANSVFHTQPLTPAELGICIGMALVLFHAVELEKWIRGRSVRQVSSGM